MLGEDFVKVLGHATIGEVGGDSRVKLDPWPRKIVDVQSETRRKDEPLVPQIGEVGSKDRARGKLESQLHFIVVIVKLVPNSRAKFADVIEIRHAPSSFVSSATGGKRATDTHVQPQSWNPKKASMRPLA